MAGDLQLSREQYFYLKGGREIKNLHELINALKSMDEETFKNHVNSNKNDFGNWINNVFKDYALADKVYNSVSRNVMIKELEKSLFEKIVEVPEEIPAIPIQSSQSTNSDIYNKLDEILLKEKELEKREQKIQEIEERIEKKIGQVSNENKKEVFFSKEFIQGLVIGALVSLILCLLYMKIFLL